MPVSGATLLVASCLICCGFAIDPEVDPLNEIEVPILFDSLPDKSDIDRQAIVSPRHWYAAYQDACRSHTPWRAALKKYAALHTRLLASMHGNISALRPDDPPPSISVYRIPRRDSTIGIGCLLPGLANVFLSAMRRGRAFLLDWPGTEGVFGSTPGIETRVPWKALAAAIGDDATRAHYTFVKGGSSTTYGDGEPVLWGGPDRGFDVETHRIFNRGVYTAMGPHGPSDLAWLDTVLPRDALGGLAYGCVYAAAVPFTESLLLRAASVVDLPPVPLPPVMRPLPSASAPHSVVCLHVRTWALEPVAVPPASESKLVAAAFRCLNHILATEGSPDTVVFVASDDPAVREMAHARFGPRYAVTNSSLQPAQSGFTRAEDADADAEAVYAESMAEWLRLAQCPALVTTVWSGYGRTAGAAGWGSVLYYYDEEAGGVDTSVIPCRPRFGPSRALVSTVGAGW